MYAFNSTQPIYMQLMDDMKSRIVAGGLPPGSKIDSVRDLAAAYGINPNTVQRALGELEREGLLSTQRTSGKFVTEDKEMVDALRARLASEQIKSLISFLETMGFGKTEMLELISRQIKEELH